MVSVFWLDPGWSLWNFRASWGKKLSLSLLGQELSHWFVSTSIAPSTSCSSYMCPCFISQSDYTLLKGNNCILATSVFLSPGTWPRRCLITICWMDRKMLDYNSLRSGSMFYISLYILEYLPQHLTYRWFTHIWWVEWACKVGRTSAINIPIWKRKKLRQREVNVFPKVIKLVWSTIARLEPKYLTTYSSVFPTTRHHNNSCYNWAILTTWRQGCHWGVSHGKSFFSLAYVVLDLMFTSFQNSHVKA